ncbi:MAG: sugar transferase [Anaerolineales bacterium]|jgi:lipopolysaccharide/colanic/teichoic acid biosynthesis glycosyltransferase
MSLAEAHARQLAEEQSHNLLSGERYLPAKRMLDLFVAVALLVLFGPLMLLIAVGIKVHSPGPILYRQNRIGKGGRPFDMLKFRSMRDGSASNPHRKHVQRLIRENIWPRDLGSTSLKLRNDSRITGLGRILRALSLDELPQFINVLRGEMSIVGPRPPLPYEFDLYDDWAKHRLDVLPGITGLWQVTARNQVSFEEMVRIDLAYVRKMSPGLDLRIIVLTPLEMLRGRGGG